MNCFYYSRYRFYHANVKHELKFLLISDIHFSNKLSSKKLQAITKQAREKQPNYILIAGDLIDSLNAIISDSDLKRLTSWLEQLGKIAPVLIGLGNHDFYRKNPTHRHVFSKQHQWFAEKNQRYYDALNAIDNVQLLNNQSYEDQHVYIFGFTQSPEYYQFDSDNRRVNSNGENLDIMLSDLSAIDQKLISNLPKNKPKLAIIHSPIYLDTPEITPLLQEFDFLISGHMHNGIVPPIINDFWRSDRGFIAPGKQLFPRGSRTVIHDADTRNIILGPISAIQMSYLANSFFPAHIAMLELTDNQLLVRKPDVKHQYFSF